jgi:hypothetical protein
LPSGEEPCEADESHVSAKGFLDGYRTYDASSGRGTPAGWRNAFAERMGLKEARTALGLPSDAGWDQVREAFHLAATENMGRLAGEYEAAVRAFDGTGSIEEKALAVQQTKFRLEAYAAYLGEQQHKLEAEVKRITGQLLARIENT